MPKQRQVLKVFLASPSDVSDERDLIAEIVGELNETVGRGSNVIFDLVRWESQSIPGIGSDPQDRINKTTDEDFDIFIGVFWTKIGTRTQRAESGSVEEYKRARERLERGENVEVLLYFKQAPVDLESIDTEQLSKLRKFRLELSDSGVLYATFTDADDFARKIRTHLGALVSKFAAVISSPAAQSSPSLPAPSAVEAATDDDLGMIELQEIIEQSFESLNATVLRVSAATELVGDQMRAHTRDVEQLVSSAGGGPIDRKQAKASLSAAASDMLAFSSKLQLDVPEYKKSFDRAFGAIISYQSLQADIENHRLFDPATLATLSRPMTTALTQTDTFRNTVQSLPRMSSDINKAKRAMAHALDVWISELRGSLILLDTIS